MKHACHNDYKTINKFTAYVSKIAFYHDNNIITKQMHVQYCACKLNYSVGM